MNMHTSCSPAVMLICFFAGGCHEQPYCEFAFAFCALAQNYATTRAISSDFDFDKLTSC